MKKVNIKRALVRNKACSRLEAEGYTVVSRIIEPQHRPEFLADKVVEEATEVVKEVLAYRINGRTLSPERRQRILEEIADTRFALYSLQVELGITELECVQAENKKLASHGSYSEGRFLEEYS